MGFAQASSGSDASIGARIAHVPPLRSRAFRRVMMASCGLSTKGMVHEQECSIAAAAGGHTQFHRRRIRRGPFGQDLRQSLARGRAPAGACIRGGRGGGGCGSESRARRAGRALGRARDGRAHRAALCGRERNQPAFRPVPRSRSRRYRQAGKPGTAYRHSARRRQFQDFRRRGEKRAERILPDGHPRQERRDQLRHPRAQGRHRGDCAVEPAAAVDDLEGGPGACLRQHGGGEAL